MNPVNSEWPTVLFEVLRRMSSWGDEVPPPASVSDIRQVERDMADEGLPMPPALVEFLLAADGLWLDGLMLFGTRTKPLMHTRGVTIEGISDANNRLGRYPALANLLVVGQDSIVVYALDPHSSEGVAVSQVGLEDEYERYQSLETMLSSVLQLRMPPIRE